MIRASLVILAAACFIAINNMSANGDQPQINIQSGVQLSWPTSSNNTYQVQLSANSNWTNLGGVLAAATNSIYIAGVAQSYRVLEMVPGSVSISSSVANGGFEFGNGGMASNWPVTTAAGGPVYGVRTNDNPHSGSYDFQVHLASTGTGPVVEFTQSGVPVMGGTNYPFTFFADALSGSAGEVCQWRILWNAGGDTGYQTFNPGNNGYAAISNSVTAPTSATSATIYLHFAGAASPSLSATTIVR